MYSSFSLYTEINLLSLTMYRCEVPLCLAWYSHVMLINVTVPLRQLTDQICTEIHSWTFCYLERQWHVFKLARIPNLYPQRSHWRCINKKSLILNFNITFNISAPKTTKRITFVKASRHKQNNISPKKLFIYFTATFCEFSFLAFFLLHPMKLVMQALKSKLLVKSTVQDFCNHR